MSEVTEETLETPDDVPPPSAEDAGPGLPPHTVSVDEDGLAARLCVDTLENDREVDLDRFVAHLEREPGLVDIDREAVRSALDRARDADAKPTPTLIAQGQPATAGADGRIEWLGEFFETHAIEMPDGSVDHYHHTKCSVFEGQHLARVFPPAPGRAGRDVRGRDLEAPSGQPVELQLDATVGREPGDAGLLVALRGGMVEYDDRRLRISDVLEVDAVNWATGSIDFEGSVRVRKDVDPRFELFGGASVHVAGTVESAQVESDGRVEVGGGMIGQGRGRITSGGDLVLSYARESRLHCGGKLVAKRELLWCEGEVAEDLLVEDGRIVGGHWLVGGMILVKELGSREEVTTDIHLGVSLDQSRVLRKLARERRRVQDRLMQFSREYGPRIRAAQRDRERSGNPEAELSREMQTLLDRQTAMRRQARRARRKELVLRKRLRRRELRSAVMVKQRIHAGVRLVFDGGDAVLSVRKTIEGPVRVQLGEDGIEVTKV